jgi:hypothetical protein
MNNSIITSGFIKPNIYWSSVINIYTNKVYPVVWVINSEHNKAVEIIPTTKEWDTDDIGFKKCSEYAEKAAQKESLKYVKPNENVNVITTKPQIKSKQIKTKLL